MKQIYRNGRFFWVNEDGSPTNMNTPVNPGIGRRREADIFSRLPDAELAGFEGPGAVPFGMSQSKGARPIVDGEGAIPTYRPLAGAQENNRGASRLFDANELQPSPLVDVNVVTGPWQLLAMSPKNQGEDAENIIISLGRQVVNQTDPALGVVMMSRFECLLEWGIGGSAFDCELDFDHGRVLSIPASFIKVSARQICYNPTGTFQLPPIEALSAGLAYGTEGGNRHGARLTFPMGPRLGTVAGGILAPGASVNLGRPPSFATHMGIYLTDNPSTGANLSALLQFERGTLVPESSVIYNRNSNYQSESAFPIPNGTQYVTLVNTSTTGVYVDGFWGLSL